jgi:predicted DNA-binding protein (UPF0251 family)
MSNSVLGLVKEIKDNLSQVSSSTKDEIRVMQAMLNDKEYEVGVYTNTGLKETYNPAKDFRAMLSGVVANTTKISKEEAAALVDVHEVTKSEASTMVNVSKEFVNTYLATGRKLPFGGRETSNIAISGKDVKETTKTYPKKVGVNEDGTDRYESGERKVPAHFTAKIYGSCPEWVK